MLYANSLAHPNGIYNFEKVTIKSGTFIRLIPYDDPASTNDYGVTMQVGDVVVENGGLIESNAQGYPAATGPGAGRYGGRGGGGGHGGMGGSGGGGAGGATYGDLYAPIQLGSGGGHDYSNPGAGKGGGAIKLVVSNTLTVNGEISANGTNGITNNYQAGGAGAGGSIWITSGSMTGNGKILANGGSGAWTYYGYSGGGGGGRIAIYTNSLASAIQLAALGGSGYENGGNGTIYLDGLDPTLSTLTVSPSPATADGTSTATVTVTLKNKDGIPVPNRVVEIALISGSGLSINDNPDVVGIDQYITIGNTNSIGVATATLRTTVAGMRALKARSGQELITQQGTVTFVAGTVSPITSYITAIPASVPADGHTPINITVVAQDANDNPIEGATVILRASGGNAVVTQPAATNAQGFTIGTVVNNTSELVEISAEINW